MKVLILGNNDNGLYGFRVELITELLKKGDVYISCPRGEKIKHLEKIGCKYIETKMNRHGKNPFADLSLLNFYKRIMRSIHPDIVLTYTIKPNIYGGLACKITKTPYIVNITGLGNAIENKSLLQKIALFLYKFGIKKADMVFFQNDYNLNFMIEHNIVKNNYKLIPGSGVNLIKNSFEEYPPESDKLVFVTIGRIMKEKGIIELLSAAKTIKEKYGDKVVFKLIGSYDGEIEKDVNNSINNGVIEYLGYREDIHDIIKNSNATIHPSYHEGTSNVLLETAACGRPILASNVPGCNNTFKNNVSGLLFEPKNVKSLIEAIEKFINFPYEKKIEMGKNGRLKMEREFDRNIIINEYMIAIDKYRKENK